MTYWTLIRRGLRFHARSHLGTLLGVVIGSAILIGALAVGDSVRESLRAIALSRLGKTGFALASNDRFFRAELAKNFSIYWKTPSRREEIFNSPASSTNFVLRLSQNSTVSAGFGTSSRSMAAIAWSNLLLRSFNSLLNKATEAIAFVGPLVCWSDGPFAIHDGSDASLVAMVIGYR